MDPLEEHLLNMTRRRFFGLAGQSIGAALGTGGLASMFGPGAGRAMGGVMGQPPMTAGGLVLPGGGSHVRPPHFAPKAKRVIYMHMEGAPSQLDLFDYKPGLGAHFDKDLPDSVRQGQRITTMTSGQSRLAIAPSIFKFDRMRTIKMACI